VFADIAHGHTDAADILLLIAVILFVVTAAVYWLADRALPAVLTSLGLAFTALAFLVL
jgi:hypothetical protein